MTRLVTAQVTAEVTGEVTTILQYFTILYNILEKLMSRTFKGTKAPGWEPWSHREQRQQKAPDPDDIRYTTEDLQFMEESEEAYLCYLAGGCSKCRESEEG